MGEPVARNEARTKHVTAGRGWCGVVTTTPHQPHPNPSSNSGCVGDVAGLRRPAVHPSMGKPAHQGSLAVKAVASIVLFLTAYGGVMLPWVLKRPSMGTPLSLANMFSAGVMLGAGLLHLLPDAVEEIETEFPWANFLFAVGLLLPLAIEKMALERDGNFDGKALMVRHSSSALTATDPESSSDGSNPEQEPDSHHKRHSHNLGSLASGRLGPVLVLLAALSFHSVLEGLAQGAATSLTMSAELLVVIMLHKGLAAFALGCVFLKSELPRQRASLFGVAFALATPLGIVVGLALHAGLEGVVWVAYCNALASGSFCYVALLEVLPAELGSGRASVKAQLAVLCVGFTLMAVLALYV